MRGCSAKSRLHAAVLFLRSSLLLAAAFFNLTLPQFVEAQTARQNPLSKEGMLLFRQNQFKEALSKFISAYNKNEDPPNACFQQAVCYYKLADYARSKQMFAFVIEKFPDSIPAQSAKGWLADGKLWASLPDADKLSAKNSVQVAAAVPDQIEIPYKTDSLGMLIVNVSINGRSIPCYFDTGAEVSLFSESQLARSAIALGRGSGTAKLTGIAGETQARLVDVELGLGPLRQKMKIFVQDDSSMIANQGRNAVFSYPLLGQDFYGMLAYSIDDRKHKIIFHPRGYRGEKSASVPFSFEGRSIIVKPKVNGRECEMILDTGACTVSFSDLQLASIGMSRPTQAGHGAAVGVGGRRESYMFPIRSIALGQIERNEVNASCNIYGTGSKPLLGRSFMKGLKVSVDPASKLVYLE